MVSCKKDDKPGTGFPPPEDSKYLLKEVTIQNLPSPYFRFNYANDSTVQEISFASGLTNYLINYLDGKISTVMNVKQNSRLQYEWTNNRVSAILSQDMASGKRNWTYLFQYNIIGQLSKITWYRFQSNGVDSVRYRETKLLYHKDFNLASYEEYGLQTDSSYKWNKSASYSGYDKGSNVDAFYLFKEFFEDLLYLPDVRIQINNARNIVLRNGANEYNITNTFQYVQGMPVTKLSRIQQTKGTDAGKKTESLTQYTYYW